MLRGAFVVALLVCPLLMPTPAEAKKRKVELEQVRSLVATASEAWDRRRFSGEPVAVRATVAIRLPGRKPLDGTWTFEQTGPGAFREELQVPGFREVLVANAEGWWLQRSRDEYLQLVADIQDALDPARHLKLGELRSISAAKSGKYAGRRVLIPRIVEKAGTPPAAFDIRVDAQTGAPVRFDCRLSHASYEYEGELAIGDSRLPRTVRVLHSNQAVVTIELERVPVREAELVLAPPEGAVPAVPEGRPTCERFRAPVATRAPRMRYPGEASLAKAAGQVRGRLLIDPEGEIVRRHVSWASDAMFAESAIAAIDARKYRPGRCGGEPAWVLSDMTFWFGGKLR